MNTFEKTLVIRNTPDGVIHQVYHVETKLEVEMLTHSALVNGFESIELRRRDPTLEETWPGWRDTNEWRKFLDEYDPT